MDFPLDKTELGPSATPLVKLWNAAIGDSFPLDTRLFSQLSRGEQAQGSALFVAGDGEGSGFHGAVLAKIAAPKARDETGPRAYLSFLLVSPRYRRQGLGGRLLEKAEAWCAEKGAASIQLGADYGHFFPGIPLEASDRSKDAIDFFSKRAYAKGSIEMDLIADLSKNDALDSSFEDESALRAAGLRFELCSGPARRAVLDFFSKHFPGRWAREIEEGFGAGMKDDDLALLVEEGDDSVAGFARICDSESSLLSPGLYWRGLLGPHPAALGPIGIAPRYRGSGLGLILLKKALATLRARGAKNTIIDWTDLDRFYAKVGFAPWKRYLGMGKRLNA